MELLLGCGSKRTKRIVHGGRSEWDGLLTADINPDHKPDVVCDLAELPLPFDDDSADEIHLYDVLEHVGQQGDWRFFFAQFADFWRILKPGGMLLAVTPDKTGGWLWGDPGHTRYIGPESLTFLCQPNYGQVGETAMTDYRFVYRADYELRMAKTEGEDFLFALQAVKPART